MRLLLLADLHANLPALEAVLARASWQSWDGVVVLGDLVGYYAEPDACVRKVREMGALAVLGNHDKDVLLGASAAGTRRSAEVVQQWTRNALSEASLAYLRSLPTHLVRPEAFVAAHGSYLSEVYVSGYITPTMLEANLDALARREGWPRVALHGHTHQPNCAWRSGVSLTEAPARGRVVLPRDARGVLLNPGSVGQPRDGNPDAAYATLDTSAGEVEFHRVPYALERTVEALHAAGLPEELGARLREGR